MVIELPADVESALAKQAKEQGIAPEALALIALRRHFVVVPPPVPANEWQRKLFAVAVDCGVSLPDSAFSSEELYD